MFHIVDSQMFERAIKFWWSAAGEAAAPLPSAQVIGLSSRVLSEVCTNECIGFGTFASGAVADRVRQVAQQK
jgi:hypothetical protein